jgi:DNA polymerase/3'-5' exonuclease PolX
MGYKKCAAILKQRPAVHDVSQLEGVRGIGKSIRDKIQEILESGEREREMCFVYESF